MTDRLKRIREMEERMDRVAQWVETASATADRFPSVQEDAFELSSYYESDLWMEDYESDETGEIPADMKRGVLSEDGLYNLLLDYEALISKLRKL